MTMGDGIPLPNLYYAYSTPSMCSISLTKFAYSDDDVHGKCRVNIVEDSEEGPLRTNFERGN